MSSALDQGKEKSLAKKRKTPNSHQEKICGPTLNQMNIALTVGPETNLKTASQSLKIPELSIEDPHYKQS